MNSNKQIFMEIIGIIFFLIIAFSAISLLSYNSCDYSLFKNDGIDTQINNLFGVFGSTFALILIFPFGLGSFWIPLLMIIIATRFFANKINIPILISIIVGGFLLIITTGSILSLKQHDYFIFNQHFSSGGLIGITLKSTIVKYLNQTGGTIILALIWTIGFIITTGLSIKLTCKILKKLLFFFLRKMSIFITRCTELTLCSNKRIKIKKNNLNQKNPVVKKALTEKVKNISMPNRIAFNKPTTDFLDNPEKKYQLQNSETFNNQSKLLTNKLEDFGITGKVIAINPGPVITTFEYKPSAGIKINKIVNLANDIALALRANSIRIIAPIPGKAAVGIEIPNANRETVRFKEMITSKDFIQTDSILPLCLGKDVVGNTVSTGLEKMPHLLIAGATGTGKSVSLNTMICGLLYKLTPDQVRLIMIDPKRIELSIYNGIPHLITPVINDVKKATTTLLWSIKEMENRYKLLSTTKSKNIDQYNEKIIEENRTNKNSKYQKLPYIVIIIDELADLMMVASRNVEVALTRLAQMARAAGIHLILATQRPSVDVLTGIIKANFPTRLTFLVSSKTDSRTIIDTNGAENLLGNGDMLFMPTGTSKLQRIHGAYISEKELTNITEFLKRQKNPTYDKMLFETHQDTKQELNKEKYDEYYNTAVALVTKNKQASISMIQRKLSIGYNRAARIVELMEKNGIVGPPDGAKPREVLLNLNTHDFNKKI